MLSAYGVKLLLDLFGQYNGSNNGDLTAAWSVMCKRGWHSKTILYRSLRELKEGGWIVMTRQGGRRICSLYGVTWLRVDQCNGKLDIVPSSAPLNTWKTISLAQREYQVGTT